MNIRLTKKGTTLFEILIVIAVILVLTIASYLVVRPQVVKAYDATRKADLYRIKNELEIYYSLAEHFPENLPDCGQPLVYEDQVVSRSIPCDPVTKQVYYYQTKGNEPQSYRLYALLTNTEDISIKDVGCEGGCGLGCAFNYGVSSMNVGLIRCSYVCAPGGGKLGSCELYQDTESSICPKIYLNDSTCRNECNDPINKCKNASGKRSNI